MQAFMKKFAIGTGHAANLGLWVSGIGVILMTAFIFAQVFFRYVLNDSASWTEEIARLLLTWLMCVGGITAMRRVIGLSQVEKRETAVAELERWLLGDLRPDLVLVLDIAPEAGLARISGDVFALLGHSEDLADEYLLELLQQPLSVAGLNQRVSVTIGMTHLDQVDGQGSDALKAASIARTASRSAGRKPHAEPHHRNGARSPGRGCGGTTPRRR